MNITQLVSTSTAKHPLLLSRIVDKARAVHRTAAIHNVVDQAILADDDVTKLQCREVPLALVYRAVMVAVNERLARDIGHDITLGIPSRLLDGALVHPRGLSKRLLSEMQSGFSAFLQRGPESTHELELDRFFLALEQGTLKGFMEAGEILRRLGVLECRLGARIDHAFELVQQGLRQFRRNLSVSQAAVSQAAVSQAID